MIARASGNWSTLGKVKKQPYVTVEPSLSNGKAGGVDGVSHEHLLAASGVIAPILANIYTWMLRLGHVPESMKKGEIITLHKGGKKRKDNPNNYRAITLVRYSEAVWNGVVR